MLNFLDVAVIQIEFDLGNVGGILEAEVHAGAYSMDAIFIELVDIMREVISTDPHLSKPILSFQNLLSFVIKFPKKHLNYIPLMIISLFTHSVMALQKSIARYRIEINN